MGQLGLVDFIIALYRYKNTYRNRPAYHQSRPAVHVSAHCHPFESSQEADVRSRLDQSFLASSLEHKADPA